MTDIPDTIVVERDRDLVGRAWQIWVRRGLFSLLPVISVLALLNLFGQHPQTVNVSSPDASLKLFAPERVRSGLLFEARFHITARRDLKKALLVLDSGWAEGMQINTIEPSPVDEASANGRLSFDLGHIPAGESHLLFMQFQINPTNVGHRSQTVELFDGDRKLLELDRSITIFP